MAVHVWARLFAGVVLFALAGCAGSASNDDVDEAQRRMTQDPTAPDPTNDGARIKATAGKRPVLDGLGPEFLDLGVIGPSFSFEVTPGTLGFLLDAPNANVVRLLGPGGTPYMRDNVPMGHVRAFATAPVPLTSQTLNVPAGDWTVELSNASPVTIAHQRTSDGAFHGGLLDSIVFVPRGLHAEDVRAGIVPGDVVDAASAAMHPVVRRKLDAFFALLKSLLDLDRGTVTFFDTEARYLHLADERAVREAFSVGADASATVGIRLLMTEQIESDETEGIAGLGAGPFPRGMSSTVIIDVTHSDRAAYLRNPATFVATAGQIGFTAEGSFAGALLHETSHLWGLSHTSDLGLEGDRDGLVDTPFCSDATIESTAAQCADRKNLMYPVNGFGGFVLSPQQRTILHAAAAYRPYDATTAMAIKSWSSEGTLSSARDPALDEFFPEPEGAVDRESARSFVRWCGTKRDGLR